MNANQKFWITTWSIICTTLMVLGFTIYSANLTNAPLDTLVRVECLRAGGTWGPMLGSDTERTCNMPVKR